MNAYQKEQHYKEMLYQIAELANQHKAVITVYPSSIGWSLWSFYIETSASAQGWQTDYTSNEDWPSHFEACEAAIQKYQELEAAASGIEAASSETK